MEGKIMVNINKNIKKVCSFYVSNCHLATMLLPHINEKINEKVKITTILEESLQVEMKMLLEKLELNNKEKILALNWNKTEEISIKPIQNQEIIIAGSIEYIDKMHKILEELISSEEKNISVIDCYNFETSRENIKEILDNHEKVLNTAGEKEKSEYITQIKMAN